MITRVDGREIGSDGRIVVPGWESQDCMQYLPGTEPINTPRAHVGI